jgi:hypothetical protein
MAVGDELLKLVAGGINVAEIFKDDSGKTQIIPDPSISGGSDEIVDFGDKSAHFKFKRLSEYIPGESWTLLYYGPSKTGKTFFAGSAGPRTLYVNTGHGMETLAAPAFTNKYPKSSGMIYVDVWEKNPKGIAEAFDVTTDIIDHALKVFPDQFDTVVLDEATAFRSFAINKATEMNTALRTNKRPNRQEEFVGTDVQDYKIEMDMIEWFLGTYTPKFKEAGKNFLMLAHERQIFQQAGNIGGEPTLKRVLPGFTGKTMPDRVPAFFDDVWHSEAISDAAGNVQYRARTAGNSAEIGGSRHGGIFNVVEPDPNYLKLLERIKLNIPKTKPTLPTQLKR